MRAKLGAIADNYEIVEASIPFPLEPFSQIAEVHEASGSEEQMIETLQVSLEEVLARSNILSLHARDTPQSRGMIGLQQIAQLQRGSVIVNCTRGSLLDYDALAEALRSGHLFAAAADVFPQELIPRDSPLLSFKNFVMTPHIAGGTRQAAEKASTIAA